LNSEQRLKRLDAKSGGSSIRYTIHIDFDDVYDVYRLPIGECFIGRLNERAKSRFLSSGVLGAKGPSKLYNILFRLWAQTFLRKKLKTGIWLYTCDLRDFRYLGVDDPSVEEDHLMIANKRNKLIFRDYGETQSGSKNGTRLLIVRKEIVKVRGDKGRRGKVFRKRLEPEIVTLRNREKEVLLEEFQKVEGQVSKLSKIVLDEVEVKIGDKCVFRIVPCKELTLTDIRVLLQLKETLKKIKKSREKHFYPIVDISKALNIEYDTAKMSLERLEKGGYIRRTRIKRKHGELDFYELTNFGETFVNALFNPFSLKELLVVILLSILLGMTMGTVSLGFLGISVIIACLLSVILVILKIRKLFLKKYMELPL